MARLLTMIKGAQDVYGIPMSKFCEHVGISRQGHWQAALAQLRQGEMMREIKELVRLYRAAKDRRAGSMTLHENLGIRARFGIGSTKFEQLI